MKKLFIAVLIILAACAKDGIQPSLYPVDMSIVGDSLFEYGYYHNGWEKGMAVGEWRYTVYALPGDTVKLIGYSIQSGIEMQLDTVSYMLAPHGFQEMKFIVK